MTERLETLRRTLLIKGRNAGPTVLWRWWVGGELSDVELAKLVLDVWTSAEFPQGHLGIDAWVTLFKRAGFVSDPAGPGPSAPIRIYRGTTRGRGRSMSWTRDLERARWFARRFAQFGMSRGYVWTTEAPPEAILAICNTGRMEAEVVVNPAKLGRVRLYEAVHDRATE